MKLRKSNLYPPPSDWPAVAAAVGGQVKALLEDPSGSQNTCAIRLSHALNSVGSFIESSQSTFTGSNGKNYIVGAETMLEYLKSSFGTSPSNTVILESTSGEPLTESKIKEGVKGKNGIYVIIPKDSSRDGFGASGHVDLLVGGIFASGHSYYYCTGGVKKVYLFTLE